MIFYRLTKVDEAGGIRSTPKFTDFEDLTGYMNTNASKLEPGLWIGSPTSSLQWWIDQGWQMEWADITWKMVDPEYKKDEAMDKLATIAAL